MSKASGRGRRRRASMVALASFAFSAAALRVGIPASPAGAATPGIDPSKGFRNIDHIVIVVQENRSFDHYFGTFPGANGIPRYPDGRWKVCVPDPRADRCRRPYHDTNTYDQGGPHGEVGSAISVNRGRMNGFIRALWEIGNGCMKPENATTYPCRRATKGPNGTPDVMGFHTAREIPNYWAYAKRYLLQDRMFAPSDSWTLPAHLFLVSAWSATCSDLSASNGMSCRSDQKFPGGNAADQGKLWVPAHGNPRPYRWADITWLIHRWNQLHPAAPQVSWRYYVGPGTCVVPPCASTGEIETAPVQNPLPGFATVASTGGLSHVTSNREFFDAAATGGLPNVSWVMPVTDRGEHPPDNIALGQSWVTKVVNAVMKGPRDQWRHTAIFLTWDDWGGFYDHVPPIRIDPNGWGIRVPAIVISPWVKRGLDVDHRTYSFDAYLKLIEDRFLGGWRLNGENHGWRDARPTTREIVKALRDLRGVFDFSQEPIPPLVLDPYPNR